MSKALILLLLSLLSFSSLPISSCSFRAIGLDTFLADQARRDPLAANDSFHALPAALRKGLAASAPSPDHAALVSYLLSLQISVPVYVKLVGSFSAEAPSLLGSFASAAHSSARFHIVGARPHHLAVGHTLHLDSSLTPQISAAIRSHLDSATAPLYRSALVSVPYSIVDQIIQEDYKREDSSAAPGFYIYLLNLGSQSKPYAYSYDPRDASPAFSKCLGTIWTAKERYMWTDLASFVVDTGGGGNGAGAGEDYLTNLPDALRLEILCLLPLKFAIHTGVLSSHWRDFWKDRWPEPSSLDLSAADGELPEDFVDQVDRCIRCRGRRPIDALRIVFHPGLRHSHDVSRWLEYAAACGVEDLHVDVSPPPPPPSTSSRRRPPRRRSGPSAFHFLYPIKNIATN